MKKNDQCLRILNLAFVIAGIMLSSCTLNAQSIAVVQNGKPVASIVIDPQASTQVKSAAQKLQNYIQKSTGATLPIGGSAQGNTSIYVGPSQFVKQHVKTDGLDQDGFILQGVDPKSFVIVGGSDWGTEYGVYEFLERYAGVRWLMPTDMGTDIPKRSSLQVPPAKVQQNPVFLSRQLSPINIQAGNALGKWGRFNRSRGRIEFHHNFQNLLPPGEFAKQHPEFYSTSKGQSTATPRSGSSSASATKWQLNFSAPGITDAAAGKIVAYFKKNPQVSSYSLGMNDGVSFDESAASKGRRSGGKNYMRLEDVSDDYFQWANDVVKKVKQTYPNKQFGCLAYNNIAEPPSKGGVDPSIVPFITYERLRWANPQFRNVIQDLNNRWSKVSPVLGWYDYAYGSQYLVPRVWFHTMQSYLSWGAAHNVKYYYAELYPNFGEGPKAWVLTKLLWNPNQNVDELLDDWYTRAAGEKAAPKLKEFYSIWEKFWTDDIYRTKAAWSKSVWQYLTLTNTDYLGDVSPSAVSRADNLMQQAVQLAGTPEQKARVNKLSEMWQFYKAAVARYQSTASASQGARPLGLLSTRSASPAASATQNLPDLVSKFKNDSIYSSSINIMMKQLNVADSKKQPKKK